MIKLIVIPVFLLQIFFANAALANITPIISYLLSNSATETNTSLLLGFCDADNGYELWQSDGTDTGTQMVKDIYPDEDQFPPYDPYSSDPQELTDVNGTIYFQADTGLQDGYGKELWKSDGTAAGTNIVKDIDTGGNANPRNLVNVNGTLFFVAADGVGGHGDEVWKSDGTEAGTVLLQDLKPDGSGSNPSWLTSAGGKLYFQANADGANELWMSDGTIDGIVQLGDGLITPVNLTDVDGILFFRANGGSGDELYKSNGTESGTVLVKDIDPVSPSNPNWLTNINGTLFLAADSEDYGTELWKSDGTETGTVLVKNIHAVGDGLGGSSPEELININGTLYFSANDGVNGRELWKSDGSETGTVLVKDIHSSGDSNPTYTTNVDGILFFTADDGINGIELWKSNGTDGGTMMVKNIMAGDTDPYELQSHDGLLFFKINFYGTEQLWISDGTEPGTIRIKVGCAVPVPE